MGLKSRFFAFFISVYEVGRVSTDVKNRWFWSCGESFRARSGVGEWLIGQHRRVAWLQSVRMWIGCLGWPGSVGWLAIAGWVSRGLSVGSGWWVIAGMNAGDNGLWLRCGGDAVSGAAWVFRLAFVVGLTVQLGAGRHEVLPGWIFVRPAGSVVLSA